VRGSICSGTGSVYASAPARALRMPRPQLPSPRSAPVMNAAVSVWENTRSPAPGSPTVARKSPLESRRGGAAARTAACRGTGVCRGVPAMWGTGHAGSPSSETWSQGGQGLEGSMGWGPGQGRGPCGQPRFGGRRSTERVLGVPAPPPALGAAGRHLSPGSGEGVCELMRQKGGN